jgi:twinkle protein
VTSRKILATHQTCPTCNHNECATVYEHGTYCHSCGAWTPAKEKSMPMESTERYKPKPFSKPFDRSSFTEEYKDHRGIPARVNEFYQVYTGIDKTTKKDYYRAYSYPHATKIRVLPKDFTRNSGFANSHLFGMDRFNAGSSKFITIVEGEEDACSAYYMLGEKYPVVALPGASVPDKLIENVYKYLDSFKEIVLAFDNDEAGQKAVKKFTDVFPDKTSVVSMTAHKDANDFLTAGDGAAFMFAWHNRKKFVPEGFYNSPSQFLDILKDTEVNEYISTPVSKLNEKIKGLMRGHLTVITGPEGQGKTEILRMFEYEILRSHRDTKIGVLHMEESKKTTLMSFACYELGTDVRDPDHAVPQKTIDEAITRLTEDGGLYLFDFEDNDPTNIFQKVRYLAKVAGCHFIFIDPIQQLSYGKNNDLTEEQVLSKIAVVLEKMANDLNVGVVLTTHVNDDGQTRSSRMIGKSASVRIDLKRDHLNEDEDIRNTTYLTVSKNRPVGKTGFGGVLKFNPKTFTLGEDDD